MSYSHDKFLRPLTPSDKNIKILDNENNIKYSIDPFSINNTAIINNLVKISLKSDRIITLNFSTLNESQIALLLLRSQIDELIIKVPNLIDKDIENYIISTIDGYIFSGVTGSIGPTGINGVTGSNGTSGLSGTSGTSGITTSKNEAGQVKINYTGLSVNNFNANVIKILDINSASASIVVSPTTTYPNSTPNNYSGIFATDRGISPTGRLIENPINGQVHSWRFQISYSNKGSTNNGSLDIILTNPISGFQYIMPFTLPSGRTTGTINNIAITIADNVSIPSPNGYILQAVTSFTDSNLTLNVDSITRISDAKEI